MIHPALHRQPVAIDSGAMRTTRLRTNPGDPSFCTQLNSIFVAITEFVDACRDIPLVFVNAGKAPDGKPEVAPVGILGLIDKDNLFIEGKTWRGRYMPAVLRSYPFCTARIDDERYAVCVDRAWPHLNETEGEALFGADGKPTPFLEAMQKQLEVLETEVARSRLIGQRLVELDLLRDMRFDAQFPDGRKHTIDGFFTIDQERVNALPDATVLELHKAGILGMFHAHWISLGNMRVLADWHLARHPAPAAAGAANDGGTPGSNGAPDGPNGAPHGAA